MITQKNQLQLTANAISGKTARACESCLKSRARWFCPADEAFLCHTCDSSVHSANELAGRHKRVRLPSASSRPHHHHDVVLSKCNMETPLSDLPTWHQGFQKKARTPRHAKRGGPKSSAQTMMMRVVPEMSSSDEGSVEESEEQMMFSVPTFEVQDEDFNIPLMGFEGEDDDNNVGLGLGLGVGGHVGGDDHWDHFNLPEFVDLPPENDLAEFAADVESLVQQQEGTYEEAVPLLLMETSGETDSKRPTVLMPSEKGFFKNEVKVEDEEEDEMVIESNCEDQFDWAMDLENEVLNFEMSNNCVGKFGVGEDDEEEEEEEKKVVVMERAMEEGGLVLGNDNDEIIEGKSSIKRRKIFLRLNYEAIINAWAGASPWTTGHRPEFDADHDGWPNYMGGVDPFGSHFHGGVVRRNVNGSDDGRQARVSRYREKRRTRLFSKKIRYEVRKLNAEKRPRLKGRFVKRTSLVGHGPSFPNYINK